MEKKLQITFAQNLLAQGIKIFDIYRIDFRPCENPSINNLEDNFIFGKQVSIDINSIFIGKVIVGNNVKIGANCILEDCEISDDVEILPFSYLVSAKIGKGAKIGPYSRIRPGTVIDEEAHIGNFVEIKNSNIGKKSKANHLTYIGDADIGNNVNVGAGTITCNYDGVNKFRTIIEDDAFIGSDSQLVAPVRVEKGATLASGTTLTKNAPAHKLTISRTQQVTIENWKRPQKINK